MDQEYNGTAWGHESVLRYYDKNRLSTADVYPSEWFFLKDKLHEGMRVLDIGCAKGFMANVLAENLKNFSYVGVDISQQMVDAAQTKFPQHRFHKISNNDYSVLENQQFDLVLCVGVLSIDDSWRNTLKTAWAHTKGTLLTDMRETHGASIEDKNIAYFRMNFDNAAESEFTAPYNVINSAEAQQTILTICHDAEKVAHYGYLHPVSELAVLPLKKVMANVYCIERSRA